MPAKRKTDRPADPRVGHARKGKSAKPAAPRGAGPKGPKTGGVRMPPKHPPQVVNPGRDAVCRYVAFQCGHYPDLAIGELRLPSGSPASGGVSDLDAGLARAIYGEVVRRWATLQFLLSQKCDTPWPQLQKEVKAAMLVGAAQVFFLDRVPAYAAIDHAVQWTKVNVHSGAFGLVNAVLRRMAELAGLHRTKIDRFTGNVAELPLSEGGALQIRQPVLPLDAMERWRTTTGIGTCLWEHWKPTRQADGEGARQNGAQPIDLRQYRALHSLCDAPVIMNTKHAMRETLERVDLLQPHEQSGHHVVVGSLAGALGLMNTDPGVWVQDPGSSHSPRLIAEHAPNAELVIDLCAGQGTKTRQLRALMKTAEILATDTDDRRLTALAQAFAGDLRVKVMPIDKIHRVVEGQTRRADVVLLDVPCSNTGVLPRRAEAKHRFSEGSLSAVVKLQREILEKALPLLDEKPGSMIVYSTCSLEPRENVEQAKWAAEKLGLRLAWQHSVEPSGLPGEPAMKYHDGSYAAGLVRD